MTNRISAWALIAALALASCAGIPERAPTEPAPAMPEVELSGREVVPPNDSPATAVVRVALKGDRLRLWLIVADMKPSQAHLHIGRPGANGPLVARLERDGGELYVIKSPGLHLNPVQLAAYKAGEMYVVVTSARHPQGEIRAQLPGR